LGQKALRGVTIETVEEDVRATYTKALQELVVGPTLERIVTSTRL